MTKTIALTVVVLMLTIFAGCGVGPPAAPTNLTVTSSAPVTLSWDGVLAATSYNIYRSTASGDLSTKLILASNVAFTTYTDASAKAGTGTFYYQVTSVNWDVESAGSNEVSVTP